MLTLFAQPGLACTRAAEEGQRTGSAKSSLHLSLAFGGGKRSQVGLANCSHSSKALIRAYSSRTCVGINVRRAWRTIARGAAKPWEPSGPAVCKTSVACLRKQSKLALFFARRPKFCRQTAPVWVQKRGAKSSGHKQIKLRLNEWPPFWGPFLDPKTGAVLSAKF